MRNLLISLSLLLFAIFLRPNLPSASAARSPLVLAFYYAWFDENTWNKDKLPDLPKIAYSSNASEMIAYHILQAKHAGIDAFVASWWGQGNPTDDNFKIVLDQAQQANFKAAVDFDFDPSSPLFKSREGAINALRYLLATHVNHPAYLRVDGKPVIFFYHQTIYSVDDWAIIRAQVDPNHQFIWIAEGIDETYQRVFDGHHLYSIGWAKNVAAELNKWPRRVKKFGAEKYWVATVMPGNDDTRTHRADSYVRERENGNFYRETWDAALSTYPDWVIITSWNEWVEGTMIEPSVTYGDLYLEITREFSAKFKAGLPTATPTNTPTPKPTATATVTRTPTLAPTARFTATPTLALNAFDATDGIRASISVSGTLRVRAAPSTDAAILGRLRDGQIVILFARDDASKWLQIAYPDAANRAWVSADFVKADANALPVANENAPAPTAIATAIPESPPAPAILSYPPYIPSAAPFKFILPP
ncbi:MAG: glycoside hydrolase family 99-like domain-containing protein [Chloroflexi bacterium]|nr:glycoside hydrolase family 99-like domain-containing protein [Chloroflexota bacterium]